MKNFFLFVAFMMVVVAGCARPGRQAALSPKPLKVSQAAPNSAGELHVAEFSPDHRYFVTAQVRPSVPPPSDPYDDHTGWVQVYDTASGKKTGEWNAKHSVERVAFLTSRDILVHNGDGGLQLRDMRKGELLKNLGPSDSWDIPIVSRNEDRLVVVRPNEGKVHVWDTRRWNSQVFPIGTPEDGHLGDTMTAELSPDGKLLAMGQSDGPYYCEVYNAESGRLLWKRDGSYMSGNITWSPDGRSLAASTRDGLMILKASNGRIIRKFLGRDENGREARFSRDGKRILVKVEQYQAPDRLVVLNTQTGRKIKTTDFTFTTKISTLSDDGEITAQYKEDGTGVRFEKTGTKVRS